MEILKSLKQKEDELDGLLIKAREEAFRVKEDALSMADEARRRATEEMESIVESHKKEEMEKIDKEAQSILDEAGIRAEKMKKRVQEKMQKAVDEVVSFIIP